MSERIFFDSNTIYGPRPNLPRHQRWSLEHLIADMDHYGIAASLVRHEQALLHDPMAGNLRLIKEIGGHRDRLFPCWTVLPDFGGDFPAANELQKTLAKHDVRAVQIAPSSHGIPVAPEVLAPLASVLAEKKTLILLDMGTLGNPFRDLRCICAVFADNPVLLIGSSWGSYRTVWTLMSLCPNLYLEFSLFQAHRVIEQFRQRFGAERLLFGSGFPSHSGGAARALCDWSLIPDGETDRVAGLNLCRLLEVDAKKLEKPAAAVEPIQRQGRQGKPLSPLVLDAHCHVMDDGQSSAGQVVMMRGDAPGLMELAERCGINAMALMSWQGPVAGDPVSGNLLIERLVKAYPASIVGLSSIDPLQQTQEEMMDLLKRLHGTLPFAGVKPYFPRNQIHYHDPVYDPVWEFADRLHLYTLLHTDYTPAAIDGVVKLAQRFPNVSFILAHVGGSWKYAELCADAAGQAPNIFCELTLTPVLNGVVEYLVEHAGRERVLFGTDAPMRDPRPQLGWVAHSRLSTEVKLDVLGRNFLKILEKNQAPGIASFCERLNSSIGVASQGGQEPHL